jgi:hypothetical protein
MSLVYASIIALAVLALNLRVESITAHIAQKARPKLGGKFKYIGYILYGAGVVSFGIGCWLRYCQNIDPEMWFSVAIAFVTTGGLLTIKGMVLEGKQLKKLGRHLHGWSCVTVIVAVGFFIWAIVQFFMSL